MPILPKINLPTLIKPRNSNSKYTQKISPKYNWASEEFEFSPDGRIKMSTPQESFENWAVKVACTERYTRLAYSDNYGVEFEKIATMNDIEAAKSEIIRQITEAIGANPETESVKNFIFEHEGDEVIVSFDVKGKSFDESTRVAISG